ncbi:MAG: hydrogenase maturation nickel metallochaperone HypA [Proteobacteria bacterium]|nr:hydrogenase maturation nickel metallochaperone HypA [Pseudomonadota bacterium]
MHEYHLFRQFIDKIEEIAKLEKATKVTKLHFSIGTLANITTTHFLEHLNPLLKETIAQDAEIVITAENDLDSIKAQQITLVSIEFLDA